MTYKIVLTKVDNPKVKLSTGSSVTLFLDGIMDEKTLHAILQNMIKENVTIQITSARLIVTHHWQ